ncbi:hypothetical protein [Edwardsiella tarda]|uniref:hypothetical protein n=1 Tax=Edwardsiella tarda TaxID=636 RepID=UPI00178C22E9|nr:hypothetical protein [Edwardsiella tarda]
MPYAYHIIDSDFLSYKARDDKRVTHQRQLILPTYFSYATCVHVIAGIDPLIRFA